jgi:serine/threonine protein kinase
MSALKKVAIKILQKEKIKDKEDEHRITREIKFLKKLKHNNIVGVFEVNKSYLDFRKCEELLYSYGICM